jgi:hypothetical protein
VARFTDDQVRRIFLRRRRIAAGVLIFLTAFTGFFIWRTFERARVWRQRSGEPIRSWMTVGYIAHTHHVPAPALKAALGLPPNVPDRRPLSRIAEEQHRPVEEIENLIDQAIDEQRKHPPEGGP